MKTIKNFLTAFLILSFTGCKYDVALVPTNTEAVISTFYFIRHAEKDRSDPTNLNPELSQEGLGRAMRWERIFSDIVLNDIYSTDFERTRMTAAPIAISQNLNIINYDPSKVNVEEFKALHKGHNVLVVGHSHTIPDFVNKMLGEDKYQIIEDYDFSSLFIVCIIDGKATTLSLKID